MSGRFTLTIVLPLFLLVGAWAERAEAQNTFRRHRPLRWLGQGFSDGYHRCDPGYDTSYYNPYSAHNSVLLSRTPQFQQLTSTQNYAIGVNQELRFFGGVPFSVYAAPSRLPKNEPDNSFEAVPQRSTQEPDSVDFTLELDEEVKDDLPPAPNPFDPGPARDSATPEAGASDATQPSPSDKHNPPSASAGTSDTTLVMPILTGGSVERPAIPARQRFLPANYRK